MYKGLCHKCHASGVELVLTEMTEKDGLISRIPLCEKCRG